MGVGSARYDIEPGAGNFLGHHAAIINHRLGITPEFGPQGLAKRHRLGGDHMHQRPALKAGKDS